MSKSPVNSKNAFKMIEQFVIYNYIHSVTPKPDRRIFVNIEKIHNKYQLLMVRFSQVVDPTRYGEI